MAEFDTLLDDEVLTGPPLTAELLERAEKALGFRLPEAYVAVLKARNGGRLNRRCLATDFPTSWAPDYFQVDALYGIGGVRGIDSDFGSHYLILEWGYPDVGVVVGECPSAGHDVVMLDYSGSGPDGEPAVAYVDEDLVPRQVAASFQDFLSRLRRCEEFEVDLVAAAIAWCEANSAVLGDKGILIRFDRSHDNYDKQVAWVHFERGDRLLEVMIWSTGELDFTVGRPGVVENDEHHDIEGKGQLEALLNRAAIIVASRAGDIGAR